MKIGEFSEKSGATINTIRHYMDLGLIIPIKKGGHYAFDERCQKDLEDILVFKAMGFPLNEIKSIFSFKRFGKLSNYQADEYYKSFFINRYKEVLVEIEELSTIQGKLENKIEEITSKYNRASVKMGVDLKVLPLLRCSNCGEELSLANGHIADNQVIKGHLKCHCGKKYPIEDGIIITDPSKINTFTDKENFIIDYIRETPTEYLDSLYKGLEWIHKKIDFDTFKNKVVLDLGVGWGFFLRHIYEDLPEDTLYIAVDHDIKRHQFLKAMLEKSENKKNIIFICADFLEMPIMKGSVDIVVDITGSTDYGFSHETFLLDAIDGYVRDQAYLIGGYILFKNFLLNNNIPSPFRKNFVEKNVKESIDNLGFKAIWEDISGILTSGGKYEDFFKKGEKIYDYGFYGKR